MKHWMAVLGMVALTGCAAQQKPVMPDNEYLGAAVGWIAAHQCGQLGYVDAENAARGQTYLQAKLANQIVDMDKFNNTVKQAEPSVMGNLSQVCRDWGILVAQHRQQIENNNAVVQESMRQVDQAVQSIQNSQPIYCNTIGGITRCN